MHVVEIRLNIYSSGRETGQNRSTRLLIFSVGGRTFNAPACIKNVQSNVPPQIKSFGSGRCFVVARFVFLLLVPLVMCCAAMWQLQCLPVSQLFLPAGQLVGSSIDFSAFGLSSILIRFWFVRSQRVTHWLSVISPKATQLCTMQYCSTRRQCLTKCCRMQWKGWLQNSDTRHG